jgi:hypothetical protein
VPHLILRQIQQFLAGRMHPLVSLGQWVEPSTQCAVKKQVLDAQGVLDSCQVVEVLQRFVACVHYDPF